MNQPLVPRPTLTLPAEEAVAVAAAYGAARVILEYGSGGTTAMAAEMAGKTVFSVESDANWLGSMAHWFDQNTPVAKLHLHHADIGPTKAWGHPADDSQIRDWPGYAISVWDLDDFPNPDTVLIDGRFRTACFLTCLFRSTQPMTVLWDDYLGRPAYHRVEDLVKPVAMIGRMARFEISPMAFPVDRLAWVIDTYLRPN